MTAKERLTKQEISWLLTQEARTAAHTLRQGVHRLSHVPTHTKPIPASVEIESSLDALDMLDDTMRMLDSLNVTNNKPTRRDNIDMSVLLSEVVADSKLRLQPGSGTEVFGDETELRRMVQMLVRQSDHGKRSQEACEVHISRQGEYVHLAVALGPDALGAARIERAWLARMALRYGGRLELKGGWETLILPATGAHDRAEIEALRKELHEAQQQGEAYARELAAIFAAYDSTEQITATPSTIPPTRDALATVAAFSSELVSHLKAATSELVEALDDSPRDSRRTPEQMSRLDAVRSCYQHMQDLILDLQHIAEAYPAMLPCIVNVNSIVEQVVEQALARAHRFGVTLICDEITDHEVYVPTTALSSVIRLLIDHAIYANPQFGTVIVRAFHTDQQLVITIDDEGTSVPASSRDALLSLRMDPSAVGRPRGIQLLAASAIMSYLGGSLEIEDAPHGGTRVRVTLYTPEQTIPSENPP